MVDLRHLNTFLTDMGVKYETLKRLQMLSRPGDWAISFDLADGFMCCSVAEEDRKYMTFMLQGKLYRTTVLPFGLKSSPAVFCKIMETLTRLLRSPDVALDPKTASPAQWLELRDQMLRRKPITYRGMRTLPFLDDYLALFESRSAALKGRQVIERVLDFLGLERQPKKCVWEPTQTLYHLGFDL